MIARAIMVSFIATVLMPCLFIVRALAQDPSGLAPPSTDPACANPPLNDCTFYANCLESRYHCGPDGYPIGYGQYFCQKIFDRRAQFDAQGQAWMTATMHCLQQALVRDVVDLTPSALTCDALKSQAFATHPECLVNSGLCTLSVHDWAVYVEMVNVKTLISGWDAIKATVETAADCLGFYAYMVASGFDEVDTYYDDEDSDSIASLTCPFQSPLMLG